MCGQMMTVHLEFVSTVASYFRSAVDSLACYYND
jgi:hypothetical protein